MPYLIGLVTSFFVATLIAWMQSSLGWDPMRLWVNLILPFGAICAGFFASLGFVFGAKAMGTEASPVLAIAMVASAAITFFAIYVLEYYAGNFHGVPLSQIIGLGDYLQLRLGHGSMKIGRGDYASTFDLGRAGFLLPLGNGLGFVGGYLGGFALIQRKIYYEA